MKLNICLGNLVLKKLMTMASKCNEMRSPKSVIFIFVVYSFKKFRIDIQVVINYDQIWDIHQISQLCGKLGSIADIPDLNCFPPYTIYCALLMDTNGMLERKN